MGFRSLQHIEETQVHSNAGLPARFVPPSGFDYPLDGFLPANPCRFCFAPTALLGFTLRRTHFQQVSSALPPGCTHMPFNFEVLLTLNASGRPLKPRLLGFDPAGSLVHTNRGLACCMPTPPLGFALLGFTRNDLDQDFA